MRIVGFTLGGWRRPFRLDIRLDWEPRDLWLGLYISAVWYEGGAECRSYYLALVPTLPIVFTTMRRVV